MMPFSTNPANEYGDNDVVSGIDGGAVGAETPRAERTTEREWMTKPCATLTTSNKHKTCLRIMVAGWMSKVMVGRIYGQTKCVSLDQKGFADVVVVVAGCSNEREIHCKLQSLFLAAFVVDWGSDFGVGASWRMSVHGGICHSASLATVEHFDHIQRLPFRSP